MRRRAFTLVELLVVIGIIAVLISILIPTIAGARRTAMDTTCAARLRDLVAATTLYLNQHRSYPPPPVLPAFGGPVPLAHSEELLNQIGSVLKWKPLNYSMGIRDLPEPATCPLRRETDVLLETYPAVVFGAPFWNTGYSYCAGVMDIGSPAAHALRPERIASIRGKKRGVIWADNLVFLSSGGTPAGYAYWHFKGSHPIDTATMTIPRPTSLRGHHRAWTDGSVEWLRVGTFDLSPDRADQMAAYKVVGPSAMSLYFYY